MFRIQQLYTKGFTTFARLNETTKRIEMYDTYKKPQKKL
jgi:hypothetical protein